ncbi:EndoU domain-containing protein [Pasteurella multocida]|uniref:EndoU domain-containing protein n=1 Tax=Pasteurella multocida TaxID=747 RepID=UPI00193C502B|nr:EndoU domain-containing protein [Pasteurella multocida]
MIVDKVIKEYPNGVYEVRVLIPNPKAKTDPTAPKFLEKLGKNKDSTSTMFPRTWTEDRLKVELEHAFKNGIHDKGQVWTGITKSDVKVQWYRSEKGEITSVHPILE